MELTRLTDERATTRAVNEIRGAFCERGELLRRDIGFQGGGVRDARLYCVSAASIWLVYRKLEQRHWLSFGTLPLPSAGSLSIVLEINPPIDGLARRTAGLIAADGAGTRYLCHTGRIGGGKKGVGQSEFVNWFDEERVPVTEPDGRSTLAFPVAAVEHARLVEQIAEYVHAVAEFKAEHPARTRGESRLFDEGSQESETDKHVPGHTGYRAGCDHAIVRNRLADLIEQAGRCTERDQQRDLLVMEGQTAEIEFEIKATCDLQSIYTAVGQLMLHSAQVPVKRRVAVLPDPVKPAIIRAIRSLDIEVVTYKWTRAKIFFAGLEHIIPSVKTASPISLHREEKGAG